MALTPPSNTDIATRQDVEHWEAAFRADIARSTAELRASTTKVVVGTGVALSLAMVGTAFAGFGLLLRILDIA
jgi:hypothetical protein